VPAVAHERARRRSGVSVPAVAREHAGRRSGVSASGASPEQALAARVRAARRDSSLALLEGLHALKHALRFGAEIDAVLAPDPAAVAALAHAVAPDVAERVEALAQPISPVLAAELAPRAPDPVVLAIARRPAVDLDRVLADPRPAPIVLLEDPRSLGNLGACVRVAAAAGAAGLLSTGSHDPWHPDVLRGAAGLHYALPVAHADGPPPCDRPLVALDPGGEPLRPSALPPRALLAFGGERHGLGDALLAAADARVAIPMRAGVSSLNLATSVAAVLYALRLHAA
jgi:RNA methyltransferase, TrmH family